MTDVDAVCVELEAREEAAVDDRTCDDQHGPFRGGCDECGRFSNKGPYCARKSLAAQAPALSATARALAEALADLGYGVEDFSGQADACIFCGDASGSDHDKDCPVEKAATALAVFLKLGGDDG